MMIISIVDLNKKSYCLYDGDDDKDDSNDDEGNGDGDDDDDGSDDDKTTMTTTIMICHVFPSRAADFLRCKPLFIVCC